MTRLDQISLRLLELDNAIATLEAERKMLREEALERLAENGGSYYSDETGFLLTASPRVGRVNPDVLRGMAGEDAFEQVSVETRVLDLDLLKSAINRRLISEHVVEQSREQGTVALLHRRSTEPIPTTA